MVMKKRLDNRFSSFSDWTVPRGPRSLRKRVHQKNDFEDGQICAIELLASLAGKLLQDGKSTACSNTSDGDHSVNGTNVVKEERSNEERAFMVECCDGGSSQSCDLGLDNTDQKQNLKKLQYVDNDTVLDCTSVVVNSNSSDEACGDVKPVIRKTEFEDYRAKPEEGSPDFVESTETGVKIVNEEAHEAKGFGIGFPNMADSHNSKDLNKSHRKSPTSANSSFKTKLPLSTDAIRSSFSRYRNYFKLASRDEDEKFRSNKSSIHSNSFRPPSRIAGQRIRKLLNSKHWKAAPKLKDCEVPRSESIDEEARNPFRKRKLYFNSERYQGDNLYKRKRFVYRSSIVNSDGGMSSESVTNSPEKSVNVDKSGLAAILHGASVSTSSGQQASFHSKDAHVKFSIRSFKVPELFIDIPENATVGSLKKIVLEAVTAILKDGLRVGVLVHGNKVRDDNRTLLQTGLSCKDNLDSVGFTLEPNLVHNITLPLCSEDPPQILACDMTELLPSSPVNPSSSGILDAAFPNTILTNPQNQDENRHELITTSIDKLPDNSLQDCKALVPVPDMTMEALAVVPLNPKSKRSEAVQRRTRRPFSVSEVEALVQAIEELGTGRWRDVKFRAFENADHRTYVDLKDKWKTLVHTAKISPQQRRGEPVPQELLDRVLAAHAYWSQHQAKQHSGKLHQAGVVKAIEGSSS
ncbi:telomere repeat-binding protein 4-like isoform X1 [Cucurbita maxima]|uniref:Telomere repeat-binding protein 4-like isoform X1 n=1 Tax=Cucurbita maxima TaxID=3661 RepID=A0A6J1IE58_CUCMA|nr:telomere repeat-binding protein 4-like isoform X1 [Cucurbita maxima]XP_022973354.1 telomere repeat-binding protein 4-like isoform X1 [Cucurbita maxima]